ncbi:uncharacterized protein [Ptychodera flava]|uniref:uncharacterized protein n=1 Tax=Ptychodera flava TaxID=63121 RepID=UPI00396A2E5B
MPLRKKKKSGKKKGPGGKGKKKKKSAKKKLTKAEKSALKLEKAVDGFIGDLDRYNNFIARMDKWILENCQKIIELFRSYDVDTINYEEFKSGMFDLDAPCNSLELHILALRIDRRKTGHIDYLEFSKGLRFYRDDEEEEGDDGEGGLEDELEEGEGETKEEEEKDEQAAADKAKDLILFGKKAEEETEEQEDEEPTEEIKLTITKEEIEHCACCKVGLWQPYKNRAPKYVLLHIRLVTFDKVKSYPGHLKERVHSHLTIYGVMQIIFEKAAILTSKLKLFSDKSRSKEALLLPSMTLEDCGFEGDVYQEPEEATIYYDYQTEFHDCPILMSDYYFV